MRSPSFSYAHVLLAEGAEAAFAEFCAEWEDMYPAMIRLWRTLWQGHTWGLRGSISDLVGLECCVGGTG